MFRAFAGINRLRLQNVGLSEQLGRNARYTGRMGADVEAGITQLQRGNAFKSVLAGVGFENGEIATIGASRKGRIWSHRREHLDRFVKWCDEIGVKLLNGQINPDEVLQGTLVPVAVTRRPEKVPIAVDWPEEIYSEPERNWLFAIDDHHYSIHEPALSLVRPDVGTPLRFEVASEQERVELELQLFGEGESADFRFIVRGERVATIRHAGNAQPRSIAELFRDNPPTIWFADGSSLEGNRYVELRAPQPLYDANDIETWDWTGVDIRTESQGGQRRADSVQARAIRELLNSDDYLVIFDDDSAGEAADVVGIRVIGGLENPTSVEVELYHCKYSHGDTPGARIQDLYEVCGQAQKSVKWAASIVKKADLFTHLMRRENDRIGRGRPTRLERGTMNVLQMIREIAALLPVSLSITIVQPGLSKQGVSEGQLQLLGVTKNFLWETYQLRFRVIAAA